MCGEGLRSKKSVSPFKRTLVFGDKTVFADKQKLLQIKSWTISAVEKGLRCMCPSKNKGSPMTSTAKAFSLSAHDGKADVPRTTQQQVHARSAKDSDCNACISNIKAAE